MRKLLFIALIATIFASCDSKETTASSSTTDRSADSVLNNAPYTATYASKFEMGDPKYSATVLDLWKIWENGDLSNAKQHFADSVHMIFANGVELNGTRDSVFNTVQNYRNMYSGMKNTVTAYVSLKTVGMDHNWVDIWGTETATERSGKVDSMNLHEVWMFNKDGKIAYMQQFVGSKTPPKQ